MKLFKSFTESVERITRFVLPGGYIIVLYFSSLEEPKLDEKLLFALIITFFGPALYLLYREVMCVVDDIILMFHKGKEQTLSSYKSKLYMGIQEKEAKFQSYMYLKFSGTHHGILISAITVLMTTYASWISPRVCLLSNHKLAVTISFSVILILACYNYLRLHWIQHAHLFNDAKPNQTE